MKKIIFLCVFAAAFFIGAFAAEASAEFETVITEKDGSVCVEDGIAEADADALGYEIRYNNKRVITVRQNIKEPENEGGVILFGTETILHGYYSVEFEVSETEGTSAFIAGLSRTNKDEVQAALINSAYMNKEIELESLDFIDAEKTPGPNDTDELLCWAAATSNVLHYTGWGKKAGFDSEDDLFDAFQESFTNAAGNFYYGLEWFFNGIYSAQNGGVFSQVRNYGQSGGYLPEYYLPSLRTYLTGVPGKMHFVTDSLRNGAGIEMSIAWMYNGEEVGGHAVTLWGYVYDNRYESEGWSDPESIKAVIISDSDSDRVNDERRMSPNKLCILSAAPYTEAGYNTWSLETDKYESGIITEFIILAPYSDDLAKETDPAATKNLFSSAEFYPTGFTASSGRINGMAFKKGDIISISPHVMSYSNVGFNGIIDYELEINSRIYRKSSNLRLNPTGSAALGALEISDLPAGEYSLRITLNPDKAIEEAYYYNNTYTYTGTIKIVDDYPDIGDVKMTASSGGQEGDFLNFSFEYEREEKIFDYIGEGCRTVIEASYYEDGVWSRWEKICECSDCGGAFPAGGKSDIRGTKVKFAASAYSDDKPCLTVYSGEYDIEYILVWLGAAENNSGVYSRLPENACSLAEGETFAFELFDGSTAGAGDTKLTLLVYAVNAFDKNDVSVLYRKENITLEKGGDPLVISISSWADDIKLSGKYMIYGGYIEETEGECFTYLGTLEVKEHTSTVITCDNDVCDDYDGMTSLREAVASCGENDVITAKPEIEIINLESAIVINKPVKIDFGRENTGLSAENPYGAVRGTAINANSNCRIFKVVNGGELNIYGVAMINGLAKDNGGAILLDGGNAVIEQSRIFRCESGRAGGGIYVNEGKLILNGCSFKENRSGYGGAIAVMDTGETDMLNCTFLLNTSNAGAVYTNGRFSAINSTFADNTAKSNGGSAVTAVSGADAALVNCIAVGNSALNGNVKVYGCILGRCEYSGSANGSKVNIPAAELFRTDADGNVIWDAYGSGKCIQYTPNLSKTAEMPSSVKNIGGRIALYDGENTLLTDIAPVFSDDDLARDALGNPNDNFCGSQKIKIKDTKLEFSGNDLLVYTYEGGNAALICAGYDGEDRLTGFDLLGETIGSGTNIIPSGMTEEGAYNCQYRKFMLWDGTDRMRPLTESVVY